MKCQHCGKQEATFHYQSTVNGRTAQAHLCAACAGESGYARSWETMHREFFRSPFSLLRDGFFDAAAQRLLTEFPAPGNTLAEAESAADPREEGNLLSQEECRAYDLQRRRNALQLQLEKAVAAEHYEEAARVRDELRSLPQQ